MIKRYNLKYTDLEQTEQELMEDPAGEFAQASDTFTTVQFVAGRTANGNPRRVFVTFQAGVIVATYDEGYQGQAAIKNPEHRAAWTGLQITTTPRQYRDLCNWKG